MNTSLLFIPDISGFTEFVQTTEVEHSQHVIAELLEVLIDANTQDLVLAEIEGDALFFYKENEIPSLEKLLAQVETMFTAFYSHLKLLEKNRVCPCHACSSAPSLQLKIIIHGAELQFISVKGKRKPFGKEVIEAHRLMKNSIASDNYVLVTDHITKRIELTDSYQSKLFQFNNGRDNYDGKSLPYLYAVINKAELKLKPFAQAKKIELNRAPDLKFEKDYPISANKLLEFVTNYSYRHHWVKGVDKFEYDAHEVTRLGTEHVCVINGKHLNFVTVTKNGKAGQLIYGERTTDPPPIDELFQFYIINPISEHQCKLEIETYWKVKSIIKKLVVNIVVKQIFRKNTQKSLDLLHELVSKKDIDQL